VDRGERMEKFEAESVKKVRMEISIVRVKRKGRARRGIIIEVRKEIEEISVEEIKAIDEIQERRLTLEGRLWRIITIYNNSSMKSKRREIEDMLEDLKEGMLCIGVGL